MFCGTFWKGPPIKIRESDTHDDPTCRTRSCARNAAPRSGQARKANHPWNQYDVMGRGTHLSMPGLSQKCRASSCASPRDSTLPTQSSLTDDQPRGAR
jgi:hypothetical protein